MLNIQQVGYSYPKSPAAALSDVSLSIEPGSYLVLLGANGSGKTTLARLANGLLLPNSGQVTVDGLDTSDPANWLEVRQRVGVVAQDPDEQIISSTVLDEVAFGPENLGLPPSEIRQRAERCLAAVGLSGLAASDPNTLSGGQKQRLVLAATLAMQPQYLVLDEPTSMLDKPSQQDFMAIIAELRAAGHGILHITHDLGFAADADTAVVLAAGRLVFSGHPSELLANEQRLLDWGLKANTVDKTAAGPQTAAWPDRSGDAGGRLCLANVYFSYPGVRGQATPVLADLSLELAAGSMTLVSGANGAGKSTLLMLAAGLLKTEQGSIGVLAAGSQTSRLSAPLPGQVGLVFQYPEGQLFAATVAEDIAFGPRNLGLLAGKAGDSREAELVGWALQAVGLDYDGFAGRSPFTLSGGEMRKVAIAGILAMRPRWLLLDEPTAGLDASGRAFMLQLIADLLAEGRAVLVVSHDTEDFTSLASQHLRLDQGTLWPA